ncbi:FG-GAP-like repeat-containing protein [Streptomyces spectabilis]|uniref:FG-GAP-like repeat-containing protein n=1 Tax=Streptomyces spectabilis TaxID=68270 RepID=UPI0033F83412
MLSTPLISVGPAGAVQAAATEGARPGSGQADAEQHSPEQAKALAKAADTGEPVEVLAQRTETSQVFANPSGTFTEERYATAQWARKGNKLVDIDTTLHLRENGKITPTATTVGLEFSSGGTEPLATITRDGRSISLTWPTALSKPTITDDTVTYPDVLPDVDLKLRAGASGFAQLLVVKTPEAAANPDLKTVAYKMTSDGVRVTADEHGNISAVNPGDQELFTAPTPRMWDSSTSQPPADGSRATPGRTGASTSADETQGPDETDEFEPGPGAQQAAMPVHVDDDSLTLTPDADLMSGKNTTYPVYIDPYVEGSRYAWTLAYKKYPDGSFYNGAGWGGSGERTSTARVGYENETNGLGRSYFRMNTKSLWSTKKQVVKSTFRIKNTWSWSCTSKPVDLYRTATIGSSTTWNNQPDKHEKLDTVNDSKGWGSNCPAGNLAFSTTAAAKDAAAGKWNTITLLLQAANESDVYGWKKFAAKSAVLSTEYNTVPDVPTGLDTIPSTRNSKGCGDTAPHGTIGNTDVYLTAKAKDRDGGTVKTRFHLWATGHHDDGPKVFFDKTVSTTSGTAAKVKVPKDTLSRYLSTAGGSFSWKAQVEDSRSESGWTPKLGAPGCQFVFDPNRPSHPPGIISSQFPDGGDGWPAVTGSVRTSGTFGLSSGGVRDVAKYEYWTDTDPKVRTATPGSAGGDVAVKFTPTATGTNHLYARSVDKAGNKSDTAGYLFYANGPKEVDKPGDINGDGNPDLWATDKDGTLRRFYGAGDGTVTEAAEPASTVTWTNVKISHRGDWTGDAYEDLIALRHDDTANTDRLWVHPNTGYGFACTNCASDDNDHRELTVYDPANNHWAKADQILAIGDVDGPLDLDDDGTPDTPSYPDLLVKQGDLLWLYFGADDDRLDTHREPILIGADGWKDIDLFAPGDTNGDGRVDLGARDRTTGDLYVYRGTGDDGDGLADHATKIRTGRNFTPAGAPLLTSPGDADNSGKSFDLWFTRNDDALWNYVDIASGSGSSMSKVSDGWKGYQALS